MSNPLRRSERIEKYSSSSSSGSKKSSSNSSSLGKKKHREERSGKLMIISTKEECEENQADPGSDSSLKKRKRLDARSYRSFLRPQTKATNISAVMMNCKENATSQEDARISGSTHSEEVHEAGHDCTKRKEKGIKNSHEGSIEVQGSSSGSQGLPGSTFGDDRQRKKCKLSNINEYESKGRNNLPDSKCTDSSSQSSLPAVTAMGSGADGAGKEIYDKVDIIDVQFLGAEELKSPVLLGPNSEKVFLADVYPETGCNIDASIRRLVAANLDSGVSLKPLGIVSSKGETCIAHNNSPSPSRTKSKDTEECTLCGKLQRVRDDSRTQKICACHAERIDDLSISDSEDTERPRICDLGSTAENLSSLHSAAIQTDSGSNACVICKNPGMLLCCDGKGCKNSYHLSCLDPPLKDIPPGAWLCLFCVKKKLKLGVYSVSEGIESVFDIKDGTEGGKLYLVKYKGLAHVHNRWVPESQMILEAPRLLAKFNRRRLKEKVIRWKKEWTEPHRLLQKRLLMPLAITNEYFSRQDSNDSQCRYEWLVKWKGLGYEHATWEFENSPTLRSFEGISHVKDYENRQEMAKKLSDPSSAEKALQVKKSPLHRLARFPDGSLPEFDNDHLNSVNRLLEFWHRSQNAIFIDDQERVIKTILFMLALQSHICRPFLIISTTSTLSIWDAEFSRLAPSINAVVYTGNKDVRKVIRAVEFYGEGGCIMFQVLLSHPDAIVEDFEALDCIGWEAVIVDECQNLKVSKHFDILKLLTADFKLLLLGGQLKDNLAECLNFLAFLDPGGKEAYVGSLNVDPKDTVGALAVLREKLVRYIAYERKQDSSKFVEFWVPVPLSNVQLEQYCATLLSNSTVLNSCSKIDHVGALRDILISTRKCCDHPYIVDELLPSSLAKGLPASEYLDIGINASGKLLMLDKVLKHIKNQGLRVLILFQSIGGSGRTSIGDILDDFLRQRFGAESYERVDSGLVTSKKVAALNMFNDKTSGRFVFLIENRACLPSIKLSSVDAVLIFDSDWNPMNDLRALQKISIESQFEQLKVFRLYSSLTIEEKILIFSKQDTILDSKHISPSVSHSLLSWGASYLFNKLDEFHQHDKPSNSSENLIYKFDDLVLEFLTQLPNKAEGRNSSNYSLLIKAQQSGASYSRNIIVFGEEKGISSFDTDPPVFWSNLLEGRYPLWKYISQSSQRIRRKVQNFDEVSKLPDSENDGGMKKKKRRKTKIDAVNPKSLQTRPQDKNKEVANVDDATHESLAPQKSNLLCNISERNMPIIPSIVAKELECSQNQANALEHAPSSTGITSEEFSELHISCMAESEGKEELHNDQRSLHPSLKRELSELCETLRLPGDVINMAERLLEFVLNKLRVNHEPESVLQALKISLCWRAAAFLKHKVDRKESLALAKKYLNFECEEEQAYSVYSKLKTLKRKFSRRTDAVRGEHELTCLEYQSSASSRVVLVEPVFDQTSTSQASCHKMFEGEIPEKIEDLHSVDELRERREEAVLKVPTGLHEQIGSLRDGLLKKKVDLIENVCSKREEELALKQNIELSHFNMQREEEMMKLKKAYDSDLELIRSVSFDSAVRNDKIKSLNHEFIKKMTSFDQHMKFQRRKLALMQADARNKERQIKDQWLEEEKTGILADIFDKLPLSDSGFTLEGFVASGQVESCVNLENTRLISGPHLDQPINDAATTDLVEPNVPTAAFSEIPVTLIDREVGSMPVGGGNLSSHCNNMNDVECIFANEYRVIKTIGVTATASSEKETVKVNSISDVESVDPDDSSRVIQETVPPELIHDTTGNGSRASTLFGVTDTTNGKIEDSLRAFSQCINMDNVQSVDPADTSRGIQGRPELECDITVENGSLEVAPSEVSDTANGKTGDSLRKIEAPAFQCNSLGGVEPVEDDVQSVENAAAEKGSRAIRPFELADAANGVVNEAPASPCNNTRRMEPSKHCIPSVENPTAVLAGMKGFSIQTESAASNSVIVNEVGSMAVAAHGSSAVPACSGITQHGSMDTFYGALQGQPKSFSTADTSGSVRGDTSMPANQVLSVSEHERVDISVSMENNQGVCSLQQVTVPMLTSANDFDADIEEISHNKGNLDSLHLQLPPDTDVPINNCSPGRTRSLLASGDKVGYERHFSPQQTETSMPQLLVSEPVQVEQSDELVPQQTEALMPQLRVTKSVQVQQSDQIFSDSHLQTLPPPATTLERTFSEDLINFHQTQCSTRPTDTSIQQLNVAAVTQVVQSNPLFNQSHAPLLPPSVSIPARTVSEEIPITSHQIPCSAHHIEVLQQPTSAAAVQVMQFSQLADQPDVNPLLRSFMTSADRTPSEAIRNVNAQHESGNHVLSYFPMSNWIPPQGLQHDPLQNELMKIRRLQDACNKTQEDKKLRLRLECDLEIEKIKKKYDALLQDAEAEFLHGKKILDTIFNKVLMNRVLAEQFRTKFIDNKGASAHAQGSRSSCVQPHVLQRNSSVSSATLPNPINIPSISALAPILSNPINIPSISALAPILSNPINITSTSMPAPTLPSPINIPSISLPAPTLPSPLNIPSVSVPSLSPSPSPSTPTPGPALAALPTAMLHSTVSTVSSVLSSQVASQVARQTPSVISSNFVRPHLNSTLQPRGNLQLGSRTPAPHLHRYRPPTSVAIQNFALQSGELTSQQRAHASLGSTPPITQQVASFPTPIGSGVSPVFHSNSLSPTEFPLDARNFHHGADPSNHVPVKEFDGWLSSNLAPTGDEVSPDVARSTATENVVYISDDDV